ncbi:MAG: cyclic nucleotide-binding domain-containing protein [Bacteroidota bacterium]
MQDIPKPNDLAITLGTFDVFNGVNPTALEWMVENGTYHLYKKGEPLFVPEDPIDHLSVLVKGEYVVRVEKDGRRREFGIWQAPHITGTLPFSRMSKASAFGIALEDCEALLLHRDFFPQLVKSSYSLTQAFVGVMIERTRSFQGMRLMDEKLMALGKMSAGLAHELNNPASAMVRSSEELHQHLHQTPERFKKVINMRVTEQQVGEIIS